MNSAIGLIAGGGQFPLLFAEAARSRGKRVVAIRHPMPYGDLEKQAVQRFATMDDMRKHQCTIEEMEEYEPHIAKGVIVYAGVDYERILRQAETEADVIIWDGGNNDLPFYKPDLHITIVDPLRAGDELNYFPGRANLRMADVILVSKVDQATPKQLSTVLANAAMENPRAPVIQGNLKLTLDNPELIAGKRVLVVEDGPTLTHGQMTIGAGVVAARQFGAAEIVDPRPFVVGKMADTFATYPKIGALLPAMGYSPEQIADLEKTINSAPVDAVIVATPIDLSRLITITKPTVRVSYDLEEITKPDLAEILKTL